MNEYAVIGRRVPRVDAEAKVTGEAKYTFDIVLPRMLYAATLRSPFPHAKILNIDTSRAEKLAGVMAVITGKEILGKGQFEPGAEHGLAIDYAHYVGEGVAAVAAIDDDTAMQALSLIKVTYEELPAVFDMEEALKPDSPRANFSLESNILKRLEYHWGDVDRGFSESDYVRQDRFTTQSVHGAYMEPFVSIAEFNVKGTLTFWSSTQAPQGVKMALAHRLGMKTGDVKVVVPYVGGGHCGKTALNPSDIVVAVLARQTGRPVKLALSRYEVLIENRGVPPNIIELKTGVKKDGTLVATECKTITDTGPYLRGTAEHLRKFNLLYNWLFATALTYPWKVPNVRYDGYAVHTNNQLYRSQRGSGITAARFACESQIDIIAADLGIDPLDMRKRNALKSGDVTANQSRIGSCGLTECLSKVAERTRWEERRGKLGNNRGLGIACYSHPTGPPVSTRLAASALVHVHGDGTAILVTTALEIGQGMATVMSQIVAEELGLGLEDVRLSQADTDTSPFDQAAVGSRGVIIGNAVKAAADDARRQILQFAAEALGTKAEELELRKRTVYVKGNPGKGIALSALAGDVLYRRGKPILGEGHYAVEEEPINFETGQGDYTPSYSFGATVVEVEVDRETGQVKVIEATTAHDIGFALNPTLVEGQIEGQVQQGTGQAIYEHRLVKNGRMLNPTFTDYRMPRSLDMPRVDCILVETNDPEGPFGAKECGEGPLGGVAPAIANAVYDAVGVRIKDLPITPEKVVKALKEAAK